MLGFKPGASSGITSVPKTLLFESTDTFSKVASVSKHRAWSMHRRTAWMDEPQFFEDTIGDFIAERAAEDVPPRGAAVMPQRDCRSGHALRHSNNTRRWWRLLLKRAADLAAKDGVDFPIGLSPYSTRHTAVELTMLSGVGYDLVAERLGHSSPRTTYASYRNIAGRRHRDAAERIDAFLTEGLPEAK